MQLKQAARLSGGNYDQSRSGTRLHRGETPTKYFAQEQRLDQVELCVRGVRESVADRRVVIQLRGREAKHRFMHLRSGLYLINDKRFCEGNHF